jgi:hypothetical protein
VADLTIERVGMIELRNTGTGALVSSHADHDKAVQSAIKAGPGEYETVARKKIRVPAAPAPAPIPAPPPPAPAPAPVPAPAPEPAPPAVPVSHATPRVAFLDYSQDMSATRVALLAKFKRGILGLGADKGHARISEFVRAIHATSPATMVGQYVCCTEWASVLPSTDAKRPALDEISANGWFLRTAAGAPTQQMQQSGKFDVNPTLATRPNAAGERWPEYLARFDAGKLPADCFDFIFQDNCNAWPRIDADWNLDGSDETPAQSASAMRAGYRAYTDALKLRHGLPVCGNVESKSASGILPTLACPEWSGALAMAYLEKMVGDPSSPETWGSFDELAKRISGTIAALPAGDVIVGLRASSTEEAVYGLCVTMLWDCYASIHMQAAGNVVYVQTPLWLPEFDAPIGTPVSAMSTMGAAKTRGYTNGRVLVNPSKTTAIEVMTPDFGPISMPPRSGRILTH